MVFETGNMVKIMSDFVVERDEFFKIDQFLYLEEFAVELG